MIIFEILQRESLTTNLFIALHVIKQIFDFLREVEICAVVTAH